MEIAVSKTKLLRKHGCRVVGLKMEGSWVRTTVETGCVLKQKPFYKKNSLNSKESVASSQHDRNKTEYWLGVQQQNK